MKIRVLSNCHKIGGGEMSVAVLLRLMVKDGHTIELWPANSIDPEYEAELPPGVRVMFGEDAFGVPESEADLLLVYLNNLVSRNSPRSWRMFTDLAARSVAIVNWQIGRFYDSEIHEQFDACGYLSTYMRDDHYALGYRGDQFVHAPAVDIEPFLKCVPDYYTYIFCRHDRPHKWGSKTDTIKEAISDHVGDVRWHFMGDPQNRGDINYQAFTIPADQFLSGKSCFVHWLNPLATEQGPRTVVEAMAAGLPVITEARGGMLDRVSRDSGWLCQSHYDVQAAAYEIASDPAVLERKGKFAREYARKQFDPRGWLPFIYGE